MVPVFYRIDPSVVRNQIGSYGDAFAKDEQRFEGNMSKVKKLKSWKFLGIELFELK